jgi:hypothetical protein
LCCPHPPVIRRSSDSECGATSKSALPPARRLPPDPCSRPPFHYKAIYFSSAGAARGWREAGAAVG